MENITENSNDNSNDLENTDYKIEVPAKELKEFLQKNKALTSLGKILVPGLNISEKNDDEGSVTISINDSNKVSRNNTISSTVPFMKLSEEESIVEKTIGNSLLSEEAPPVSKDEFLSRKNREQDLIRKPSNRIKVNAQEVILESMKRDLLLIWLKLRNIIFPFMDKNKNKEKYIIHWDLWGPLIFSVLLSTIQEDMSIFGIFWLGGFIIYLNGYFLGVKFNLFQMFCLLGYCLFPINIISFLLFIVHLPGIIRLILVSISCFWSIFTSISFNKNLIPGQKYLVLYPYVLYYAFIAWTVFFGKNLIKMKK